MLIKLSINFLIFLIIYEHFFTSLGNTFVFDTKDIRESVDLCNTFVFDTKDQVIFSLLPLFTEGFIGPVKTLYFLLTSGDYVSFLKMFFIFCTNFWSPYAVILLVYLFNKTFN